MRRIATCLRNECPEPIGSTMNVLVDDGPWGFHAIDGLPDLEAAPPYTHGEWVRQVPLRLASGVQAVGYGEEVTDELVRIQRRASAKRHEAGRSVGRVAAGPGGLSIYEEEACLAMVARRDAMIHLQQVLADDVSMYEGGIATIQAGLVMEFLDPAVGGTIRRTVSEVMAEFEAARHRFRLALVAVAIDKGMSAAQIGHALSFSRQLAGRYSKEARERWPELAGRDPVGPADL